MESAVALEIHAALGRVQTVTIGQMIQKAINAAMKLPAATPTHEQLESVLTDIATKCAALGKMPTESIIEFIDRKISERQ